MNLLDIEGIGPTHAATLERQGLTTTAHLLERGGTKAGRKDLSESTGISEKLILEWVNHADLCRIHGVAGEYADLLEAAGVDSIPELAQRSATNLHVAMQEMNENKNLVRQVPGLAQVQKWIAEAKTLPRLVHH